MSSQKLQLADYSSFTHLLQNGGDLESPAQRKELQATIEKSTKEDIPALELDIQQFLTKIHELEATKERVQTTVSKFKELLSPTTTINRLPTEILVEIFLVLRDMSKGDTTTITQGVWPLTHVSHKWRSITLSLPKLWINITIGDIKKPAKNELQILNTALARSGSYTLHLEASFPSYISPESNSDSWPLGSQAANNIPLWPSQEQLSKALIGAVVQHSDRWATAYIHVMFADCLRPIYRRLSSLEKLTFCGELYNVPLLFAVAPKLRDVELFNAESNTFQLPWKQFVRFHETQCAPEDDPLPHYLQILSQNPQLEDFGDNYDGDHEWVPHQSLTHHKLRNFMCSDYRLVRRLTLPSLQNLHLRPPFSTPTSPKIVLAAQDLVNRSQCASSLRVLRLESVMLDRSVFDLLGSTTGLTELNFTFSEWKLSNGTFMKRLIDQMSGCQTFEKSGKQVPILPRLEFFTINIRETFGKESPTCNIQFIDEMYVDMVEARWTRSGNDLAQLRVVKFEAYIPATLSAFTDRCIQRMKKMTDEGLQTHILTLDTDSTRQDRKEKIYVKY
ncbi:hypothetical protein F5880DRAFT_1090490 [Lentinula raphanica]|nr:hypothetical protein F5880DRAFT_1090490 [Lentinula raphanica]